MKFEVNGKKYDSKPFNMNSMCDLEELGIVIPKINKVQFSFMRAYLALCGGMSLEEAGKEFEIHLSNDGTFDSISEAISYEMEHSSFFPKNKERATEAHTESKTKATKDH